MGEDAERLSVVFITVDPDRDTAETMAEYVGYFHPAIRDDTMNHTASVFLFYADGRFVSTVDCHEARDFAVPRIRRAMEEETKGAT